MFQINGVGIPAPISWQVVEQPVTTAYSGKATLDGRLHNSVIRKRKVITAKFGFMNGQELKKILELLDDNTARFRFPDAAETGFFESSFIVNSITRPLKKIIDGESYWTGLQIKLTEV